MELLPFLETQVILCTGIIVIESYKECYTSSCTCTHVCFSKGSNTCHMYVLLRVTATVYKKTQILTCICDGSWAGRNEVGRGHLILKIIKVWDKPWAWVNGVSGVCNITDWVWRLGPIAYVTQWGRFSSLLLLTASTAHNILYFQWAQLITLETEFLPKKIREEECN